MLKQHLVAERFGHIIEYDDFIAQPGAIGNVNLEILLLLFRVGGGQFLVGPEPGFLLRLAGLGSHSDPLQLVLQGLASTALLLFLKGKPLGLLVQP